MSRKLEEQIEKENSLEIYITTLPEDWDEELGWAMLSPEEALRCQGYMTVGKRREFLYGRYFLKSVLGQFLDRSPEDISLRLNSHKRPYLEKQELQFNLTHSFGVFALILHPSLQVGIDLEPQNRQVRIGEGRHVFGPGERKHMASLEPAGFQESFLRRWTLKEAIYKAADQGTALLFNEFEVDLQSLKIQSNTNLLSEEDWLLGLVQRPSGYCLAYAVKEGAALKLAPNLYEW